MTWLILANYLWLVRPRTQKRPILATSPKAGLCSKNLSFYSQISVVPTLFLKQMDMITETTSQYTEDN